MRVIVKFKDGNIQIAPVKNVTAPDGSIYDFIPNVIMYHTVDENGLARVCNVKRTMFNKYKNTIL